MKVVVVASGELDAADVSLLDGSDLVIAADGGADSLAGLDRRPDLLVGDLDSISPAVLARLEAAGTRIERHPIDKEASDAELALETAFTAGATEVVLLGTMGGDRLDHALANLLLLAGPSLAGRDVRLVHRGSTARVLRGGERRTLSGSVGDVVTLLPLHGDAAGVRTEGLRWPLHGAALSVGPSRGLSNEIVAEPASVELAEGLLLVVEHALERGATQ